MEKAWLSSWRERERERDRRDECEVCKDLKLKGGWRWPWWKKYTERNERECVLRHKHSWTWWKKGTK